MIHTAATVRLVKGSSDSNRLIFEFNVGKNPSRHITTLNFNCVTFNSCMPYPNLSDIDFKNKMALVWITLNKP